MESSFEHTVRERLADYLADISTLDDFKTWLVSSTWNGDETGSSTMIRFAYEIKLLLAEHSSGFRSDQELRQDLLLLLDRIQRQPINPAPLARLARNSAD